MTQVHNNGDDTMEREILLPGQDGGTEMMDELIRQVDDCGSFQRTFNNIFNFFTVIVGVMSVYSLILAMKVPDHWCHVPGREMTNCTLAEWKRLTLPRDNSKETVAYSKCQMYNDTVQLTDRSNASVVGCKYGWDYDRRWFSRTVPSQENWVCDRKLYVTNTFVMTQVGEAMGTISFGHLSDTIGRRPVFLVTLALLILGRGLSVLAVPYYTLYLVTVLVGHSCLPSLSFAATTIGIELSSSDHRAFIVMLQSLGWTGGMCLIPLVAWLTGDWMSFVLIPLVPTLGIFICSLSLFPESPRWLASKGKIARCMDALRYIATSNKQALPETAEDTVRKVAQEGHGRLYGPASFLSSRTLAINTALLITCWMLNIVSYVILLLNVNNMSGNPFLNFFWQSAVEFPAGIIAKCLSDRVGRRTTHTVTFLIVASTCFTVVQIVNKPHLQEVSSCLVIFIKFCVTITNFVCYLQAMEIFPTCLRQTGISIANLIGNVTGTLAPYVVYLGTALDQKYPYMVLGSMALLGTIATAFIPETLNRKLPDNITDARHFGRDHKFWSFFQKPSELRYQQLNPIN